MTREDVLKLFPDATDEQITNLLNKTHSEISKEKTRAEQYKAKADKADELQTQLDDLNSQNLSEVEKATKALEDANKKIAELEKRDAVRTQRTNAMEKFGITAEQASKVVTDDGGTDYEVLGQIFADGKKNAIAEFEKQKLADTPNPNGTKDKNTEQLNDAEKIAMEIGKNVAETNKTANAIVASYL